MNLRTFWNMLGKIRFVLINIIICTSFGNKISSVMLLSNMAVQATLLVPQSVTLADIHVNRSFIETHVVISAAEFPGRFVSVNGVRAVYSTDEWYLKYEYIVRVCYKV